MMVQLASVPFLLLRRALRTRSRAGVAIVLAAITLASPRWGVEAHAENGPPGHIRFRGHMAVGDSAGEFRRWQITRAFIDEEHPEESEVDVAVDLASLETGNSMRDRHLQSSDFLDVDRYPTAEVTVRGTIFEDEQHFSATVQLNLHGRSKSFPMHFTVTDRARRLVASAVVLKRSDFAVGGMGSFLNPLRVDDEVDVSIEVVVPPATHAQ